MLRIWLPILLLIGLCCPAQAQGAPPPTTHAAPATKTRFRPGKAQAKKSRVRQARARRYEDIRKLFAEAGMDYPPRQALMRIFKNLDLVELWVRPGKGREFVHLKNYKICMRSGELGPKRQRGDGQVPEGFYHISSYNPWSNFLLSMLVSYPNRSDRLRKTGRDAGGAICIHGSCVTIGCVPLTDRWIEELYLICLDTAVRSGQRTLVHIFPDRLSGPRWLQLQKDFADSPGLVEFWKEIKVGYDLFEESGRMPRMWFSKKGAYRFKAR